MSLSYIVSARTRTFALSKAPYKRDDSIEPVLV